MYISIGQGTWIRLTRQVAVIGLADLERRALRGRSRVRDVKLRNRRRDAMARQGQFSWRIRVNWSEGVFGHKEKQAKESAEMESVVTR
jgi:hypothetical protein